MCLCELLFFWHSPLRTFSRAWPKQEEPTPTSVHTRRRSLCQMPAKAQTAHPALKSSSSFLLSFFFFLFFFQPFPLIPLFSVFLSHLLSLFSIPHSYLLHCAITTALRRCCHSQRQQEKEISTFGSELPIKPVLPEEAMLLFLCHIPWSRAPHQSPRVTLFVCFVVGFSILSGTWSLTVSSNCCFIIFFFFFLSTAHCPYSFWIGVWAQ